MLATGSQFLTEKDNAGITSLILFSARHIFCEKWACGGCYAFLSVLISLIIQNPDITKRKEKEGTYSGFWIIRNYKRRSGFPFSSPIWVGHEVTGLRPPLRGHSLIGEEEKGKCGSNDFFFIFLHYMAQHEGTYIMNQEIENESAGPWM